MRNRLLIVLLLVIFSGCKSKRSVPIGILPPPQMQALLWDMMRADQFLADYVLNRDTSLNNKTETLKLYQQVFAIHKIDRAQFQQSFSYYQSHPDLLKAIMDSISTPPKEILQVTPLNDTAAVKPVPDSGQKVPVDTIRKDSLLPKRKLRKLSAGQPAS